MNEKIKELLAQITDIEDEIEKIVNEQQEQILYFYEDGKIKFKEGIEDAHRKLKKHYFDSFLIASYAILFLRRLSTA